MTIKLNYISFFFIFLSLMISNSGVIALFMSTLGYFMLISRSKIFYNISSLTLLNIFYSYILIVSLYWNDKYNFYSNKEFIRSLIILLLYSIIIYLILNNSFVKAKNFIRIYEFILYLNLIIMIIQIAFYLLLNVEIIFPWQPNKFSSLRMFGLMSEPSHNFLLYFPWLIVKEDKKFRKKFLVSFLITILTASANVFLLFVFFLFRNIKNLKIRQISKIIQYMFIIFLIVIILSILDPNSINIINRLQRININEGSTFSRVFKGFVIFSNSKIQHVFFGYGTGNVIESVNNYSGKFNHLVKLEGEYMSGFFVNIFSIGIIGVIFYYVFLFKLMNKELKKIFIYIIIYSFVAGSSFFNYSFYTLIILSYIYMEGITYDKKYT